MYTKIWQRKQPFMEKIRRAVKCKTGLWFLSAVLNIYVCTKFNFNPLRTWYGQDKHPLWKKWLRGDNWVIYMGGLWFLCTTLPLSASIYKPSFILSTFQDMARTNINYGKWLWGHNSINIQGRIMVLGYCPSPHCHLSINQVSFYPLSKIWPGQTSIMENGYGEITQ